MLAVPGARATQASASTRMRAVAVVGSVGEVSSTATPPSWAWTEVLEVNKSLGAPAPPGRAAIRFDRPST